MDKKGRGISPALSYPLHTTISCGLTKPFVSYDYSCNLQFHLYEMITVLYPEKKVNETTLFNPDPQSESGRLIPLD